MTRSIPVEVRRGRQASARRSRVEGRQRWDRLPTHGRKRRAQGGVARRARTIGSPPRTERRPQMCLRARRRAAVPPKFGVRRQAHTDPCARVSNPHATTGVDRFVGARCEPSVVRVRKGRIFPARSSRKARGGMDSAARQTHYAGRRGLHRVGRHGCAAPHHVAIRTVTREASLRFSPGSNAIFRAEGGPDSRVWSL